MQLAVVSTNEVFDGTRTDGRGYAPGRGPAPDQRVRRQQARSRAARDAARWPAGGTPVAIVRTSWLHGPPGNDFPAKIAGAALRAQAAGEPLRVVGDEIGTPTYTPDVADAIVELIWENALFDESGTAPDPPPRQRRPRVPGGLGARGPAATGINVAIEEVPASTWQRASTPPLWAVLEPTPLPSGEPMRDWRLAFADAVPALSAGSPAAADAIGELQRHCNPIRPDRPAVHTRTGAYCPGPHRTRQRQPERASAGPDHPAIGPALAHGEAEQALICALGQSRVRRCLAHRSSLVAEARSPRRRAPRGSRLVRARRHRPSRPPTVPRSRSSSGRPTARRRATDATPTRSTPRRSSTRTNVVKVYSPNATWCEGQGGRQRRVDRRVPRPRQRLAEPVHLRSPVHDQERLRAEHGPQPRRQAERQREQVLRRAEDRDAGVRPPTPSSSCSTSATPRATRSRVQRRPEPVDREAAGRQLRGRVPPGRRRRRRRERPQPRPVLHRAPCSRPARRSTRTGAARPTSNNAVSFYARRVRPAPGTRWTRRAPGATTARLPATSSSRRRT